MTGSENDELFNQINHLKRQYNDILESIPDAIVIVNNKGKMVYVNSQVVKLFEYPKEEMLGYTVDKLVPKRYAKHPVHREKYMQQPVTRGMGTGLELFGLRKDGSEFPVEISLSPLHTNNQDYAISAIRDVSERKQAEKKFRGFLESAPDAIVIVDKSGKIVLINSQAEKMFLYNREELIGKPVEILVPERYSTHHPDHRTKYFNNPKVRGMGANLELFGLRKDGSEFPVEISLSPLETEAGLLVSSAIRDMTDRKQREEERRQDLRELNRKTMEASRLKSKFLANMSHELRTPLNGIIGFTEFILNGKAGPINEDQEEYLNDVFTSGKHLLHLINEILDLTKIESGKMELNPEWFSPGTAIENVIATINSLVNDKELKITTVISADISDVYLDPYKFKQILYNLLSNAVKFSQNGGRIDINVQPEGENYLKLDVSDQGIGIKEKDLEKLFVEFQQIDSELAQNNEGSGLGLAITKKIIELQGGSIDVESEYGEGSTFSVVLPKSREMVK